MYFIQVLLETSYWDEIIQNAIGGTIGSFLAILFSFIIYWLTIRQANVSAAEVNRENENNQLKAFALMLKETIKMVSKQSKAISEFIDEVKKQPNEFPLLSMYSTGNLRRVIDNITVERTGATYMKYFSGENSAKEFIGILEVVDYLNSEFTELAGLIQRANLNHHNRKLEVARTFDVGNKLVMDYINRINPADPIGQKIKEIKLNFDANRGPVDSLDSAHSLFFLPLNNFLEEILNKGIRNDLLLELFYVTSRGREYFQNLDSGYKKFEGEIFGIASEVDKNLLKLESTASKLLKSEFAKVN